MFLTLLSFAVGGYLVLFYPRMVNELGELTADKIILGALAILLVMEACRRMSGWVLIILAALLMFYAHFAYLFPGILNARGISWSKLAVHLFIDPNSLLGIPLAIAATTVVSVIVFGQFLYASGGGDFFTQLAMTLIARFRRVAAAWPTVWIFVIPMALIVYILFLLNLSSSRSGVYAAPVSLLVTFFRPD